MVGKLMVGDSKGPELGVSSLHPKQMLLENWVLPSNRCDYLLQISVPLFLLTFLKK
jgi:predicted benzoate:H+ symporter BenE